MLHCRKMTIKAKSSSSRGSSTCTTLGEQEFSEELTRHVGMQGFEFGATTGIHSTSFFKMLKTKIISVQ